MRFPEIFTWATASIELRFAMRGIALFHQVNCAANGTLTVLYQFLPGDGAYPGSVLLLDEAGNLYGTTEGGGSSSGCGSEGCGVVFELSPQSRQVQHGRKKKEGVAQLLLAFRCNDGEEPKSPALWF